MKKAFTLTEVVIILVVIGIIAALTVPSVVENARERANIASYRKAVDSVDRALKKAFIQDRVKMKNLNTKSALANILADNMETTKRSSGLQECSSSSNVIKPGEAMGDGLCHFTTSDGVQYIFTHSGLVKDDLGHTLPFEPYARACKDAEGNITHVFRDDDDTLICPDGTSHYGYSYNWDHLCSDTDMTKACYVVVDVNGSNPPNRFTRDFTSDDIAGVIRDRFAIRILSDGSVIPATEFDKAVMTK